MAKLWFLGEALIDFVPTQSDAGSAFLPACGGSPFNAAKAAALAGGNAAFLGAISTDLFGDRLIDHLTAHGVDTKVTPRSPHASTLAFVDLESGDARYAFFNAKTSTSEITPDPLDFHPGPDDVLHVGSISLIDRPGADNIARFVEAVHDRVTVCVDPNARPTMTPDPDVWQARLQAICDAAGIIKISDEDLDYLVPGMTAEAFAAKQLGNGAGLVVVTRGAAGAEAFCAAGHVREDGHWVEVVDTVGAGDTITGFVLADLAARGLTGRKALRGIDLATLRDVLRLALGAAAITCTRVGCQPPTRAEAEAFGQPAVV